VGRLNAKQATVVARVRSRKFRPLSASRQAFLETRWNLFVVEQPRLRALRRRLLSLGGLEVVPLPDPDLEVVLARGEVFDGRRPTLRPDRASSCHSNVARLWRATDETRIVTGWALTADGLWRQHSWALDLGGRVIETTEKRILYYGAVLAGAEAEAFAARMLRR
jgi:hypothetical protein